MNLRIGQWIGNVGFCGILSITVGCSTPRMRAIIDAEVDQKYIVHFVGTYYSRDEQEIQRFATHAIQSEAAGEAPVKILKCSVEKVETDGPDESLLTMKRKPLSP